MLVLFLNGSWLESHTVGSDSLVREGNDTTSRILSNTKPEKLCMKLGAPSSKAKYTCVTDSEPVP
jgi:hypothetical protein